MYNKDYTILHIEKGKEMDQNQNPENQSVFTENNSVQQSFQTNNGIQDPDPSFVEYQAPVYASQFKPIKKKFNPLAVIIPACVAVIAAVAVLLVFLLNQVDYKKSEKKYFDNLFSTALSSAKEQENTANPHKISLNFQSPLSNLTGNILDISNIDLIFDEAVNGKDIYSIMGFKMGDVDINAEYWFNSAKKTSLMALPGISDIYLMLDANGTENESNTADYSEYVRVFSEVLSKTADTYFEVIGDVEVQKDQSFVVGVKTYTADKSEIHLNAKQIAAITRAFYNNILDSEDAVKLLCDSLGYENKDELKNALDNAIDFDALEKAETEENYPWFVDMTVYMKNNEIIGRSITVRDEDEKFGFEVYCIPQKDSNVYYISARDEEKTLFTVNNEDSVNGDVHSGTVEFMVNGSEAALTYSDFAVTQTLFQGKTELTVKNEPAFSAKLELKTEGDVKTVEIVVPNIFTMTIKAEPSSLAYKGEPQLSDSQLAVISNNEEVEMSENLSKFMEDIYSYIMGLTGYGDLYEDLLP